MDIAFLGSLVTTIMILGCYSFYFKRTVFYKMIESTYIGATLGMGIAIGVRNILDSGINPIAQGNYMAIIPVVLGLLYFARVSRRWGHLSRLPVAIIVGIGMNVAVLGAVGGTIIPQLRGAMVQIVSPGNPATTLGRAIAVIFTFCVLYYFFWHTWSRSGSGSGVKNLISRLGRIGIMMAFGASFGINIIAYGNLVFERLLLVLQFFRLAG
jgi:hypothetical protein